MKKYDLLTPEGTRDLIYDECAALRSIGEKLRNIFVNHGYTEVITPGLEFFDVFNNKSRSYSQEALYKLTDGKGRLMVLRPDSTMPIARLVGTRLSSAALPLRLFYDQTIYRAHPKDSGRDDEFYQCGVEIIGGDETLCDMEALSVAVEVMESLGDENYRFEIGDSGFFRELCDELELKEQEIDDIREYVLTKNYPELKNWVSRCMSEKDEMLEEAEKLSPEHQDLALRILPYLDDRKILGVLPSLFGGKEVFEKARELMELLVDQHEITKRLDRLERIYDSLCTLGIGDKLSVDLSMVGRSEDYYTGIVFKGYIESYGMPVLTGGRYDRLIADFGRDTPATGFAVNENAAAAALLGRKGAALIKAPDVLIYADEESMINAVKHCRSLTERGLTAEYAGVKELDAARELMKAKGIKRLDIVGRDSVRSEEE